MRTHVIVVVLLASCGSETPQRSEPAGSGSARDAAAADPNATPALAASCAKFAEASCAAFQRCFADYFPFAHGTVEACRANEAAICLADLQLPGSRVTDATLASCIAAIPERACPFHAIEIANCAPPPGALPDGATCVADAQCAGGACDRNVTSCGTCRRRLAEGARCTTSDPCAKETECRGTCLRRKAGALLDACENHTECHYKYLCIDRRCQDVGKTGDRCRSHDECHSPLACIKKRCQPPTLVDAGAECTRDFFEPSGERPCKPGLTCTDKNRKKPVCVKRQALGDACKDGDDHCPYWAPCIDGQCKVRTMADCQKK